MEGEQAGIAGRRLVGTKAERAWYPLESFSSICNLQFPIYNFTKVYLI